jgi:hypothetical protein
LGTYLSHFSIIFDKISMMHKVLSLLNLFSVILVIGINYISQAVQLNGTTIGEVSQRYDNLFTPASYAFAIWGLIFLGLAAFAIFQVQRAFFSKKATAFIEQTGYWFLMANLLNSAWVIAFVYDFTGLSVMIMMGILFSLIKIILNTNMEHWDAPKSIIAFVWWPISLYSGWIAVATIANIAAYLTKLGWNGAPLSETSWTMIMIGMATVLNLFIIKTRHMREFAAVGAWALLAICIRHWGTYQDIALLALTASIMLLCYILWQGFKFRKSNPFYKSL